MLTAPDTAFTDWLTTGRPEPVVEAVLDELDRWKDWDVLDLSALFIQNRDHARGPVFCKTDSHWSGIGCVLAAQAIAEKVRGKLPQPATPKEYAAEWKEVQISGDLDGLMSREVHKPGPEKIAVQSVSEKGSGAAVDSRARSSATSRAARACSSIERVTGAAACAAK